LKGTFNPKRALKEIAENLQGVRDVPSPDLTSLHAERIVRSMAAPNKTTRKKSQRPTSAKARVRPLSNARLLKLAAKSRPPQSWYDETIDPTKPAPARRER
jgi:hypothetical protein